MARLKERKLSVLRKGQNLFLKANRSDILEGVALLSEAEKQKIKEIEDVVMRISVQCSRLDELIMVLRDF